MSAFDDFISRLDGVRPSQSNNAKVLRAVRAFCPCHQSDGPKPGRTPALSTAETIAGVVLMRCHAGCTPIEITGSVGMTLRDLFPDSTDAITATDAHSGPLGEWRGLAALVDSISNKSEDLMWASTGASGKSVEQIMEMQTDLSIALGELRAHARAVMKADREEMEDKKRYPALGRQGGVR